MEPKSIGPYQLIRRLGEGGMGQVWLAEQTTPIQRQVALKLIKVGRYDDSVLQRFYAERQSLAIMEHPAIARVFDAGTTPDGQPYFVMEYVPGVHITNYCDHKRLKIRERLELFVKVCEGVQHAHQKAIMHRDLKPANILVVEVDGKPVPRIIDFGLAKAASPQMDGQTMFTQVGGWVGTPGYMSPEQADPSVLDVDTRTDVYSLGAVLYELLTGFLPFDSKDWRKQPFDEFLRRLREEDPPRPSTKVDTEKGSSKTTAEVRGTDHKQLVSLLHGDLDWITMKALEKDRARRYGTPSELAADIQRYLSYEPVVARPASAGYRLRKYARRHRMGVGVAAGLVLLLAGFAAMQATQLQRITRERDRADREATAAKSVSDFLLGLFDASDPSRAKGSNVTARELLDRGRGRIETGLADQPELQARMLDTIGRVYLSLGFTQEARPLIERALETRQRLLGPEHPDTLTSLDHLGQVLEKEGRFAEAEKLIRTTLDTRTRVLGPTHPDTLASRHAFTIVTIDRGDYVGGEKLNREELGILRRVRGPDHPDTVLSMYSLAVNLADEGKPDDAVAEYREALEISRRALGPLHPTTLRIMYSMGGSLADQQKYDEAEKLLREALEGAIRVYGPEHPQTLWVRSNLASERLASGHPVEAESLDRETLAIRQRVLGAEHPETLMSMTNLSADLDDLGRFQEADTLYRETIEIKSRVLGKDHPGTAVTKLNYAVSLTMSHRREEAVSMLIDAVDHGLALAIAKTIERTPDFDSLKSLPKYADLIAHIRARNGQVQQPN